MNITVCFLIEHLKSAESLAKMGTYIDDIFNYFKSVNPEFVKTKNYC